MKHLFVILLALCASVAWATDGALNGLILVPEGIDDIRTNADGDDVKAYKLIEDQHVIVIRNGKKYDVTGKELK